MRLRTLILICFGFVALGALTNPSAASATYLGPCYSCWHCDILFVPDEEYCCDGLEFCSPSANTNCWRKWTHQKSCTIHPSTNTCIKPNQFCPMHLGPGPVGGDGGGEEDNGCGYSDGWCPASCSYCW